MQYSHMIDRLLFMETRLKHGVRRAKRFCIKPCGVAHGQAMIEYVMTAGVLLLLVTMLAVLLYTFREHGSRVLDLVASEYP